jgi:CubicO group peptidase (beta-lactamase class C family)
LGSDELDSGMMALVDPVIDPLTPRLDALATRFLVEQRLPGLAVGVVRAGALAWTAALGFADRASSRPVTADTLFRIASITKSFTATAILQLRDEGRLRLDDPLVAHLPEARVIANPFGPIEDVTIRRLLTHTSGLQGGDLPGDDPWRLIYLREAELIAHLDRVVILAAPESAWRYSNIGYVLLGAVVGRVSREPYDQYVQRAILDIAGLTSTAFAPSGDLAARTATGYGPGRHDDDLVPSEPYDPPTIFADGGLWSTVEDLARWLMVQSRIRDEDRRGDGDRVLDGRTLREMQHPGVLANEDWTYAQGLGWASTRIGEAPWVGHTGSLNGFRAIVLFRPKEGLGVIALTNGSVRPNPVPREIATAVLEAHRAAAPALPTAPPAATPASWRELLGTYQEDEYGFGVRIEMRDGALVLINEEDSSDRPALIGGDDPLVFTIGDGESIGERCLFLRGSSGAIAGLNVAGIPLRRLAPVER